MELADDERWIDSSDSDGMRHACLQRPRRRTNACYCKTRCERRGTVSPALMTRSDTHARVYARKRTVTNRQWSSVRTRIVRADARTGLNVAANYDDARARERRQRRLASCRCRIIENKFYSTFTDLPIAGKYECNAPLRARSVNTSSRCVGKLLNRDCAIGNRAKISRFFQIRCIYRWISRVSHTIPPDTHP